MLRSVIGSMDLEQTLTSRDRINAVLRGVLDEASGKMGASGSPGWRSRPSPRHRSSWRQWKSSFARSGRSVPRSWWRKVREQAAILKSEGQAAAIKTVFNAIHEGRPDPELLAYQYVQALPQIAQSQGSSVWVIPSEVTTALSTLTRHWERPGRDVSAVSSRTSEAALPRTEPPPELKLGGEDDA